MRAFRVLAVVLIGVGLIIQGTAYAATPPPTQEVPSSHCAEMAPSSQSPTEDAGDRCCGDMQMGCLVSMGCIAPFVPPAGDADASPGQLGANSYSVIAAVATAAFVPGPEPPPPQTLS